MIGPILVCGEIEGQSFRLVPTGEEHMDGCVRLLANPLVTRFLGTAMPVTRENELKWLTGAVDSPTKIIWSIMLGDKHIGQAGIHDINPVTHTATTGIMIDPEYWGKGIATAVMQKRAEFAFNTRNLRGLYTEICILNEGSWKAAQKAGYVQYSTKPDAFYIDGSYVNAWEGYLSQEHYYELNPRS